METNQVNTELETLREQLVEFKGRLNKQEIINERLLLLAKRLLIFSSAMWKVSSP